MIPTDKHYHAVQFYKDDESLAATVGRFLGEGVKAGQPGIVIATPSHTKMILAQLELNGLNPAGLQRTGELLTLDARKVLSSFMVGTLPDPLMFKSNVGDVIDRLCAARMPCPIRAYGEMVDLLWQCGNSAGSIKLEMLWNQLASSYDFELLCGYAFGSFYKETRDVRLDLEAVISQHSEVVT
jgi:hypothetical protein